MFCICVPRLHPLKHFSSLTPSLYPPSSLPSTPLIPPCTLLIPLFISCPPQPSLCRLSLSSFSLSPVLLITFFVSCPFHPNLCLLFFSSLSLSLFVSSHSFPYSLSLSHLIPFLVPHCFISSFCSSIPLYIHPLKQHCEPVNILSSQSGLLLFC